MIARVLALALVCAVAAPALARDQARTERVQFAKGEYSTALIGTVKGYETVSYLVGAKAGQTLTVTLKTSNASSYFNVAAPGAEDALFVGSSSGNSYSGKLTSSGDHVVSVYLMRNAARRSETARYTLTIGVR